jgi:deferrochelatase/peroxidase EfeB
MDEAKVLSRRRFLAGSAAVGAAAVAGGVAGGLGAVALGGAAPTAQASGTEPGYIPFDGPHQAGIVLPTRPQTAAIFVTLDAVVGSKAELATTIAELTARSRQLTAGLAADPGDPLFPPPESGILGPTVGPSDLTITVGFGASLFDGRFGLADRIPRQLVRMPDFRNDRIQGGLSHGDLLLQICATDEASCLHALRYLMLGTRGSLVVRWLIHGFQQRPGGTVEYGGAPATRRNLLGFKDGTANLPAADPALMDELVWVGQGQGEPDWAVGGTYLVARTIRMFVERWDRTALGEQEAIIGRTKRTGTPLGKAREHDDPAYGEDPNGERIALDAHIRLANPRTPETEPSRLLRRGYSYSRGFDGAGLLDEGLFFVAFQRDLERGFVTVQNRLSGEPLEEYIQPVGGGYFFAPPGTNGPDAIWGASLLA